MTCSIAMIAITSCYMFVLLCSLFVVLSTLCSLNSLHVSYPILVLFVQKTIYIENVSACPSNCEECKLDGDKLKCEKCKGGYWGNDKRCSGKQYFPQTKLLKSTLQITIAIQNHGWIWHDILPWLPLIAYIIWSCLLFHNTLHDSIVSRTLSWTLLVNHLACIKQTGHIPTTACALIHHDI